MCGRARCTVRADDIPRACHRTGGPVRTINMDRYCPSYNVAPGSNIPVIRRDDGSVGGDGFVLHCMKWGLIPSFTKKTEKPDFYKMFNARSESIAEKASFRRLLSKSRCLVVVEGFYEWKKDGSKKQPYYIHFKDGRPLVFAALYDSWQNSEGEVLYTFTIVTTSSSSDLQWLHDRMPVILGDKESTDAWLNGSSSSKYDKILKPYEGSDLVWYLVTPAMGKPSFDGPECIKEIQVKTEEKNSISNFFLKKDIKKEQASNTKESSFDEFVKINQLKDKKEEPEVIKKVKEEQKSSLDEKCSSDIMDQTNLPEGVKEEPVTADDIRTQSSEERGDHNAKSITSMLSNEGTTKFSQKRDYEFIADSKSATDRTDKLGTSPSKRKGNLKDVDDKQPTLFSYFSKK